MPEVTGHPPNRVRVDFYLRAGINLEPQARHLIERLDALGVPTAGVFFDKNHVPPQAHGYQFNLDSDEGPRTLDAMMTFLRSDVPRE